MKKNVSFSKVYARLTTSPPRFVFFFCFFFFFFFFFLSSGFPPSPFSFPPSPPSSLQLRRLGLTNVRSTAKFFFLPFSLFFFFPQRQLEMYVSAYISFPPFFFSSSPLFPPNAAGNRIPCSERCNCQVIEAFFFLLFSPPPFPLFPSFNRTASCR